MKKLAIFLAVLLVWALGQAVHLYTTLQSEQKSIYQQGAAWATKNTPIANVTDVQVFNGQKDFLVIRGTDNENREIIAWQRDGFRAITYMSKVFPEDQVRQKVENNYSVSKLIHITPGIDDNQKFWEVVFLDQENKLQYLYFDLFTGDLYRSYRLPSLTSS